MLHIENLEHKWWWPLVIWLPLVILLVYVVIFGVDIPFGDPWSTLLPHIEKFYRGTLTWKDMLSQNNEHRPFFPRLILIPLAVLTGWNTRIEMGVQLGFSVATFFLIKYKISLTWKNLNLQPSNWLLLVISLLVFSLNQWENWLNGYQLLFTFWSFFTTLCLFLLARASLSVWRFVLGLICAVIAQYSISAGVLLWIVGFIEILLASEGKSRRIAFSLIWVVSALVSTWLYFQDFHFSTAANPIGTLIMQPHIYLLYVFTFLGAPIMTFFTASVIGIIGSGLFILISYDTFRKRKKVDYRPFLPYAGMCVHAMLLALMVGLGRMGEKWWLALSPRYVGFSVWFWVGLVTLVWLKFDITSKLEHFDGIDRFWRKYTTYFIHTVFILSLICSLIGLGLGIYIRYIPVYMVRTALVSGNTSDDILVQLYPDPTYLRSQLEVLKEYHLSFYR